MIQIEHLTKKYTIPEKNYKRNIVNLIHPPTTQVCGLQDVDLKIESGEFVGLVGLNGAGKTTLIKMMTGILTPTAGTVQVMGYCPHRQRKKYTEHIGVVMAQKSVLFYDLPVIESLKFFQSVYRIPRKKFEEKLKLFQDYIQIESLLHIPVRKLSLGQRMKCEIVASLLHDPEVLFLDEPTLGLDILSKRSILDLLQQTNQRFGTTMILTTHDIEDIDRLCRRIVLLDHGKIAYDGDISKIQERSQYKMIEVEVTSAFQDDSYEVLICEKRIISDHHFIWKIREEDLMEMLECFREHKGIIKNINISDVHLEDVLLEFYAGK